ncbi:MAG: magnesium/cobalt transporter CorA [Peptococcaceae bacterium]
MSGLMKSRSIKSGRPPGTLVHIGERKIEDVTVSVINYSETTCREKIFTDISEALNFTDNFSANWINIDGIHNIHVIEEIGRKFNLHPLLLEDILNTDQRPITEDFADYLFVVLKMFDYAKETGRIKIEQISLVFGNDFLISFQEEAGDIFDPIRDRLRTAKTNIRKLGTDYLAYALIDAIIDNYYVIMENVDLQIEQIEEELLEEPGSATLQKIHNLKKNLIILRKSAWPLREVIAALERTDSELIKTGTKKFLRDVYDHAVQVIDLIETFQDILSGMIDVYLSSVSNRMNEIMKVLTIISTIFIPMTFISGIYGMNFKYMPELEWRGGYFTILIIMALIPLSLLFYFKKKKWL